METVCTFPSTAAVASRFVELYQKGLPQKIYDELFADNAKRLESIKVAWPVEQEAAQKPGRLLSFAEILWQSSKADIGQPIVAGNHFAVVIKIPANKHAPHATAKEEVAVFRVEAGKIVSEQFFH